MPAFATFFLTKDWWLLAYFGAFIWFGITGIRNLLQSILGGAGLRRSPLLRWNAYVSWDRIADSLLFTGFSVPLLDYLIKTIILDRWLDITTSTHPILLYTFHGDYQRYLYFQPQPVSRPVPGCHPRKLFSAACFPFPIAFAINYAAGALLATYGITATAVILQKWAAIISKTASDIVAGIIEGAADRYANIRLRYQEYKKKMSDILDIYAQIELLFPETNTLELMEHPQEFQEKANAEAQALEKIISIHALDALYIWMYQPQGTKCPEASHELNFRRRAPYMGYLSVYTDASKRNQPNVH